MAGGVVDGLQLVDIAQEHRQRSSAVFRARHRALEALVERAAVGQAGERVLVGQARHPREELRSSDGEGQLPGDGLEEAHVLAAEARLARRGGRVHLAPDHVLDEDGHPDVRLLAEPLEECDRPERGLTVVDRVEERDPIVKQALVHLVVDHGIDLVGGIALLPGPEGADVDDRAQHAGLPLVAAHRQRGRVDRRARLLGRHLEDLLELVGARRRSRYAQQRIAPGRAPESRPDHPGGLHALNIGLWGRVLEEPGLPGERAQP